uniref:Ig-like domain-containing protein n=1 Tax=Cyanoderma ruficeps TaxID=181631 RepID=A0A8C3P1Y7_9PASS
MPCPHPAVPSPVVALAGWCPLSPTGTQTTQLLVKPAWTPAVLWDRVTLTCRGWGAAGATTWYKDRQRWDQKGLDHVFVDASGTYMCHRPGSGLSPSVTVSDGPLVLQVPTRELLEGDTVTLRCRGWQDMSVAGVQYYHGDKEVSWSSTENEWSLSTLQLHHNGHYHCKGLVTSRGWQKSGPVTLTV